VEKNPVLSADMLDKEVSPRDFRDPKVIKRGDYYYCLAGTRIINPVLFKRRAEKIAKEEALKEANPSAYLARKEAGKEEEFTVVRIDQDHEVNPSAGEYDQNDLYHVPVLGRTEREALGNGNMILFRTKDFEHFEYLGKLFEPQEGFDKEFFILDGVYECPDYFTSNGTEILLASPQNLPQMGHKFQNVHSVIYMTGNLDFETGHFEITSIEDLDSGFDIYASQVVNMPDGRHVMIAWKEMWDRPYPTKIDNWVGTYTLPRELEYKDGHLYQSPVREIDNYRHNRIDREKIVLAEESLQLEGFRGRSIEIQASFIPGTAKKVGVKLFKGKEHETLVYYDADQDVVVFDRSKSGIPLVTEGDQVRCCPFDDEEILRFQIFLDVSSVEVFINGGRYTMTANVYPDPGDTGVEFFAEDGVAVLLSATKYTIRDGNQRVSK
jgi:beta-fructofuranosidase